MLMILTCFVPMLCGLALFAVPALKNEKRTRNLFTGASMLVMVLLSVLTALQGDMSITLFSITPTLPIVLQADALAHFFAIFFSVMWTISGFYAFRYMDHAKNQSRYFAFYLLTGGALCALSYAGTMVTMYLFFEAMTLLSVALVLHEMTREAIAAGVKYLLYSIAGATMGLLGIFFLTSNSMNAVFTAGGMLNMENLTLSQNALFIIVLITLVGFGAKAGLYPLHAWLPTAHPIAPAPASAALSGVITKAGVLCIVRILFYVVGADVLRGTWVQYTLIALAMLTVFMGSMMAYRTDLLKKRLAYSTVSQVSYVLLGVFMLSPTALTGSFLHVIFHSLIKTTLFLAAGAIIHETGKTRVSELRGIGKEMPVTVWCYTIASLGLIGIPPTGGFVSKWYLAQGALSSGTGMLEYLAPAVLLISALLTAAYLLPITIRGFFPGEGYDYASLKKCECGKMMVVPMILCSVLVVLLGMFPGTVMNAIGTIVSSLM
ncbi:MAG: proton-conducting membrane transporter [Clostridia bacterium]|nr:proton-conducting membrane transporter [Clostridia bacterium]